MTEGLEIRERRPGDDRAVEALYPDAFPEEDLLPLVRDLRRESAGVVALVGLMAGTLVGHVVFTDCRVTGRTETVVLLGPLAVAPARQRQGIGTALVRAGLRQMENAGAVQVFVLGDPAYYGRFGFRPEEDVAPPYPLPEAWRGAWQSLGLRGGPHHLYGQLAVPDLWRRRELWGP